MHTGTETIITQGIPKSCWIPSAAALGVALLAACGVAAGPSNAPPKLAINVISPTASCQANESEIVAISDDLNQFKVCAASR